MNHLSCNVMIDLGSSCRFQAKRILLLNRGFVLSTPQMSFQFDSPRHLKRPILFSNIMYFSCSVDDGFPTVKFYFEGSLSLTVYPHEYLFQISVSNNVSSRILFKILTCQVSFYNLVTVFFFPQFLFFNIPPDIEIMLEFHFPSNTLSYMIMFVLDIIVFQMVFHIYDH